MKIVVLDDKDIWEIAEEEFPFSEISEEEIHQTIMPLPEGTRVVCTLHL